MEKKAFPQVVASALLASFFAATAIASDKYEPNNGPFIATTLHGERPAQLHDLQALGGVADEDWFWPHGILAHRSYDVLLSQDPIPSATTITFGRYNADGSVLLQDSVSYFNGNSFNPRSRFLRWVEDDTSPSYRLRVVGVSSMTSSAQYQISLRETTLYCPRFNNTATQVSVLILQSAETGVAGGGCNYSARFFSEANGAHLGSADGSLPTTTSMVVVNTSSVAGVGGQKGSARIAHTCGYGNLKSKLVALEPATGFSFDTPCTMREQ